MKKQLLLVLLAILPMMVNAEEVEIDGLWYNLVPKVKTAEVIQYKNDQKYSGNIIIPDVVTYEGIDYCVNRIGAFAFSYCYGLTSISISDTITNIGRSAFEGCDHLESITIPNSVTNIDAYAFYLCSKLISITLPNSVTNISNFAFAYCNSLNSILIPNSVKVIGNSSFDNCSSLTSINIPDNVTSIGDDAFNGCSALTSLIISKNVTCIGSGAFNGCSGLASVTIPNSVTSIGAGAFSNCIGLNTIIIPNNIKIIDNFSFKGCSKLTSITIPNCVTNIGSSAFEDCSSLTSITLGNSVNNVGSSAFANCPNLTDVFCYGESVPYTSSNAFDDSYIDYATLHVPEVAYESYRTTEPWSNFGTIKVIDGETPVVEKCATPTITYANGKVKFACETEDVQFVPAVSFSQQQPINGNELEIGGTFTVSVYAVKEGYDNSDTATMTINMSQMGDVNADGELNAADITAVVNAILGK